jgi:tRNA (Thr-GGU) A37 N-methylase
MPAVGIFATRAPIRPNPIGLTLVELVRREGNVLFVKGLDALSGTLVLDIKPYPYWMKGRWIVVTDYRAPAYLSKVNT